MTAPLDIDRLIFQKYEQKKNRIKKLAEEKKKDQCLEAIFDIWMYMNRFRNCDLDIYFDEDIHDIALGLNETSFETKHLLKKKEELRIAFITDGFSDTGGASLPHRFMLPSFKHPKYKVKQYLLVTNLKNITNYHDYASYKYLKDNIELEKFEWLSPSNSWIDKGERIQNWIRENEIDAVIVSPDPASLYALGSNPAPVQTILSQDCYTWTLGPGIGDMSFFVTTDQVFKYKFKNPNKEKNFKVTLLPLHTKDFIEQREKLTKLDLGIPEDAVVSGTTNMWKCFFGENEDLMEGIAELIRRNPKFHHIFGGTPRCLDNLEFFLNKNPDLKNNIHYGGIFKNIYSLLEPIDFWINSYPTSGGSDIEMALLGKPSIEFLSNRNLDLHGCEFLKSRECDVVNLDEFIKLGERFIKDKRYRDDLGSFLKTKIEREFNKEAILNDVLYSSLVDIFERKVNDDAGMPTVKIEQSMHLEKYIAFYNSYLQNNGNKEEKVDFIKYFIDIAAEKPFGWIKLFELTLQYKLTQDFKSYLNKIPSILRKDFRVLFMIALNNEEFLDRESAISNLTESYKLIGLSTAFKELILNKLVSMKETELAHELCKTDGIKLPKGEAINIPVFYNY